MLKMPPAFYELTPTHIQFICDTTPGRKREMLRWETMLPANQHWYRSMAWWALQGAKDPGMAAAIHTMLEMPTDPQWDEYCRQRGWPVHHPKNYRELEELLLPKPIPSINLIMARCPQMALLHALGGNVSEPYWWAGLSVTEHAEPNMSKACSDGYPGFSIAELEYRQKRIKTEDTKPALCRRFSTTNPNVCERCRFKGVVNSPIALGFEHEPRGELHA